MIEKIITSQDTNFIGSWFLDDLTICDDLVTYFNNNPGRHYQGGISTAKGYVVNTDIKKTTQLTVFESQPFPELTRYLDALKDVCLEYVKRFPATTDTAKWAITEGINIQFYNPGEGYFKYHSERMSGKHPANKRHLVFMTYLNTVTDAGETEFYHQKLKVNAEKGLTLIWPADWTHYHRGIPSPTQDKYIITGWFSFNE